MNFLIYSEGGEAPEQVAQISFGCLISRSVQGQVGWIFEQPGLMESIPAYGRVLELNDL